MTLNEIPIQRIPHVHPDYVQINHCINNLNEVIWEIAKGKNVWQSNEDLFGFHITGLDVSNNILSVIRIEGNVLGKDYSLSFSDTSQSYYQFCNSKDKGYLALIIYSPDVYSYIFTETKDRRELNTDKEKECASFITQLCNMVRVVKCAPPYPHKWKKMNKLLRWTRKADESLFLEVMEGDKWVNYKSSTQYVPDAPMSSNSGFATAQKCLILGYKYIKLEEE